MFGRRGRRRARGRRFKSFYSCRRGSRQIEHIGSAHDDAGLELLKAVARQRLAAGQDELDWAWSARSGPGAARAAVATHHLDTQHSYGIPATQAPVFCLCNTGGGEMPSLYLESFERVWTSSAPLA